MYYVSQVLDKDKITSISNAVRFDRIAGGNLSIPHQWKSDVRLFPNRFETCLVCGEIPLAPLEYIPPILDPFQKIQEIPNMAYVLGQSTLEVAK